jgi:cation diffusion facilitator family transporter
MSEDRSAAEDRSDHGSSEDSAAQKPSTLPADGSRRAIIAAFLANLGIAVVKFVGFFFTGAASILAEAVHSVADTSNQGLLLMGERKARRRPTPEHPFGFGTERYFWAFIVALVIFTVGSLFALFEGEEKLRNPHRLESAGWAVAILLLAVAFESFSLRTAVRESTLVKGDESWWAFIRRAKVPELPVVLLEDVGALIGLVFALAGVGLAELTGNARFDAAGSIAIGLLLGIIAMILVVEMKSLLIGEAASPAVTDTIARTIESMPHVRRVIHMRTQHLGPDELLVGAKVEFDADLTMAELAAVIDEVEAAVRAAVSAARVIYIEPDMTRARARDTAAG